MIHEFEEIGENAEIVGVWVGGVGEVAAGHPETIGFGKLRTDGEMYRIWRSPHHGNDGCWKSRLESGDASDFAIEQETAKHQTCRRNISMKSCPQFDSRLGSSHVNDQRRALALDLPLGVITV